MTKYNKKFADYILKDYAEKVFVYLPGATTKSACYDKETEILTDKGWKYFKDVEIGEHIATLNIVSNKVEYNPILNIYQYKYNDKLYSIENTKINLHITSNHNLLYKLRQNNSYKFHISPIEDLLNKNFYLYRGFVYNGKKSESFILNGVDSKTCKDNRLDKIFKMEDWLEFLGWYLSEGHTAISKTHYTVSIPQKDDELFLQICDVVKRLGFKFQIYKRPDGLNTLQINSKQLAVYLKQFGNSESKFIPREILELDKYYLLILFKSLMNGDGTNRGVGGAYYTISKTLADNVQELAFRCNLGATVSKRILNNGYCVNITNKLYSKLNDKKWSKPIQTISYNDYVYCVEVSNHTILVRRNGKACWSGNSYDKFRDTGYSKAVQNYLTVKAFVRNVSPNELILRQIGLVAVGAKKLIVKNNDVNLFRLANRIVIKDVDYYVYNDAVGKKAQILELDENYSEITLFRKEV